MKIDKEFIEKVGININEEYIELFEETIKNLDSNFQSFVKNIVQNLDTIPELNYPFMIKREDNFIDDQTSIDEIDSFEKKLLKQSFFIKNNSFTIDND